MRLGDTLVSGDNLYRIIGFGLILTFEDGDKKRLHLPAWDMVEAVDRGYESAQGYNSVKSAVVCPIGVMNGK